MKLILKILLCQLALIFTANLSAQFVQQGNKLVGTGNVGECGQGYRVAVSADGNTILMGGNTDNSNQGAAWVFTRTGNTWTQQGNKLVGTGKVDAAFQGGAIALSADGNTALIGGSFDNGSQGAAWVFTRTGTTWTQQGTKLVGTGSVGKAEQGTAVALSADGNTALVGGSADNTYQGATWVFTRTGTTWTQQGTKLVGTGSVGSAEQGGAVKLSADGNTALVGGTADNSSRGAAWVFTRLGSIWTQQDAKLVGTGSIGSARQGYDVALSTDGNTALSGALADNSNAGAVWVFKRTGNTWAQQGSKLVGTGNAGTAGQGRSVALSANGNMALVGGSGDNNFAGAAWVFARTGETWAQQGSKLVGTGNVGNALQGFSVALSGSGNTALIGGYLDNSFRGATWVFFNPSVSTKDIALSDKVKIYPSVSTGNLTIEGAQTVEVVNTTGQVVHTSTFEKGSTTQRLDLSHLPNGLYLLKGRDTEWVQYVQKLVKQ